jgi:hypothetical protein
MRQNYADITGLEKKNLEPIARKLISFGQFGLISKSVRDKPSYKSFVNEIESIIDSSMTVKDIQDNCKNFLKAFKECGGAAGNVATTLEKEWNVAIKEKFYFDFIVS